MIVYEQCDGYQMHRGKRTALSVCYNIRLAKPISLKGQQSQSIRTHFCLQREMEYEDCTWSAHKLRSQEEQFHQLHLIYCILHTLNRKVDLL